MPELTGLSSVISRLSRSALDLVFPLQCFGCGSQGQVLCASCVATLPRLSPPFCPLCAQPGSMGKCGWCASRPPEVDGIRAAFHLEGAIREAVHAFKYRGLRAAAPELARLLADHLERDSLPGTVLVLVPVPLHSRRLRGRGYNQAALLARELGKLTGLAVNEGLLSRVRDTPPQVQTGGRTERAESVAGSFRCAGDAKGLSVIVLDDVTTTGSTLSACAAALKRAGASSVWGLALAKEA